MEVTFSRWLLKEMESSQALATEEVRDVVVCQ